jgi:hypothetical protein
MGSAEDAATDPQGPVSMNIFSNHKIEKEKRKKLSNLDMDDTDDTCLWLVTRA